jgi:hypothetical protein
VHNDIFGPWEGEKQLRVDLRTEEGIGNCVGLLRSPSRFGPGRASTITGA